MKACEVSAPLSNALSERSPFVHGRTLQHHHASCISIISPRCHADDAVVTQYLRWHSLEHPSRSYNRTETLPCPDSVIVPPKEALWIRQWNPPWVELESFNLKTNNSRIGDGAAFLEDSSQSYGNPSVNDLSEVTDVGPFNETSQDVDHMDQQRNHVSPDNKTSGRILQYPSLRSTFDVLSWSSLISAHARLGQSEQVIKLYHEMYKLNVEPNVHVFVTVLKACAATAALTEGKWIHIHIIESGLESHLYVSNTLIHMYAKCDSLWEAESVFDRLAKRDVVTWNVMIAGYGHFGHDQKVLELFQQMQHEVMEPNSVTLTIILKACSRISALEQGRWVHGHVCESGFDSNVFVGNTLIDMYAKCGSIQDAWMVFDALPNQNIVTWNTMISSYALYKCGQEALHLFQKMLQKGIAPDKITFICILKACFVCVALVQGKWIHSCIIECGFETDLSIGSVLIDMYAKCGSLRDAHAVFDRLPKRDLVAWSALIAGCAYHGHGWEGLQLFQKMQQEGIKPDKVTFLCTLKACSSIVALGEDQRIHSHIIDGDADLDLSFLGSSYNRIAVFDTWQSEGGTWRTHIGGSDKLIHGPNATQPFWQAQQEGIEPDEVTCASMCPSMVALEHGWGIHSLIVERGFDFDISVGNTLIDMYCKCGNFQDACMAFDRLPKRDTVTWNVILTGHAQHGHFQEALTLFQNMQQESIQPNEVTYVCIMKACSSIAALQQGRQIHASVIESGFDLDVVVGTTLIDMYNKCCSLEDACVAFERLLHRDVVTWVSMIAGCAQHSSYMMAFRYFKGMGDSGLKPNDVTFLCLLSACTHSGLLDEGCLHYNSMIQDHGIVPRLEHYNSMIELLGIAGHLTEAEDLLETIPFGQNVVGWTSLLGSCQRKGSVELGRQCFERVLAFDQENASAYMHLSNIYVHAGMWEDAEKVEGLRRSARAWKRPAKAFVEVDNRVHDFVVGDKSHPRSNDIYAKLETLSQQMKEEGYKTRVDLALDFRSDAWNGGAVCGHCERLAIAFGLLCTKQGMTIRVAKNLRMCADCHMSTKLISKIEMREIIVIDSYCIHQFKDGACSCKDYHS